MLNREALLAAAQPKTKDIDVPEWGGTVRIREIVAGAIVGLAAGKLSEQEQFARLAVLSIIDESGAMLFQDTPEDRAAVLGFAVAGLMRVVNEVNALNGIINPDVAIKNSNGSQ